MGKGKSAPQQIISTILNDSGAIKAVNLKGGGSLSKAKLVRKIDAGQQFMVNNGGGRALLETVHPTTGKAYARTEADSKPGDNLGALPSTRG